MAFSALGAAGCGPKIIDVSTRQSIQTDRLKQAYFEFGTVAGQPLILIHGNVASSDFFTNIISVLPAQYHIIAPDLRGFGQTETKTVDATRGVKDWSDDLKSLVKALDLTHAGKDRIHLLGWSLGGAVAMQYAMSWPDDIATITLEAPISPFGYGGTQNTNTIIAPNYPDYAGTGGALVNPAFVDCIQRHDVPPMGATPTSGQCYKAPTTADPAMPTTVDFTVRSVLETGYFYEPVDVAGRPYHAGAPNAMMMPTWSLITLVTRGVINSTFETTLVTGAWATALGPGNYPGDQTASSNWPGFAPGVTGVHNAISPKYLDLSGFANLVRKDGSHPPLLWIRGRQDLVVSNFSPADPAIALAALVPNYPGTTVFPPQPMITQTAAVLAAYAATAKAAANSMDPTVTGCGATNKVPCYLPKVYDNCGHAPHIEQTRLFLQDYQNFLENN